MAAAGAAPMAAAPMAASMATSMATSMAAVGGRVAAARRAEWAAVGTAATTPVRVPSLGSQPPRHGSQQLRALACRTPPRCSQPAPTRCPPRPVGWCCPSRQRGSPCVPRRHCAGRAAPARSRSAARAATGTARARCAIPHPTPRRGLQPPRLPPPRLGRDGRWRDGRWRDGRWRDGRGRAVTTLGGSRRSAQPSRP